MAIVAMYNSAFPGWILHRLRAMRQFRIYIAAIQIIEKGINRYKFIFLFLGYPEYHYNIMIIILFGERLQHNAYWYYGLVFRIWSNFWTFGNSGTVSISAMLKKRSSWHSSDGVKLRSLSLIS